MSPTIFDFSLYTSTPIEDVLRHVVCRAVLPAARHGVPEPPVILPPLFASLSDDETQETATGIWDTINLANLRENVLPTRQRADLIMHKGDNHTISSVALRKL